MAAILGAIAAAIFFFGGYYRTHTAQMTLVDSDLFPCASR
jgi:hypothetical protein